MTILLLVLILLALAAGAGTYPAWSGGLPVWGRDVLWLLAAIAVGAIIVAVVNNRGF